MAEVMLVARVDDSISHTYKKLATIFGTSAGLAAGAALAYFTRGKGHGLVRTFARGFNEGAGLIGLANWATTSISDAIGPQAAGRIQDGARRTWTEDERNARITDPAECADPAGTQLILAAAPLLLGPVGAIAGAFGAVDAIGDLVQGEAPGTHTDAKIKQGSETVFVEDRNAARIGDKTTCEGTIASAARRTWMGGASVTLSGHENGAEEGATVAGTVTWIGPISSVLGQVLSFTDGEGMSVGRVIGVAKFGLRWYAETLPPQDRRGVEQASYLLDVLSTANDVRSGNLVGGATGGADLIRNGAGLAQPVPPRPTLVDY